MNTQKQNEILDSLKRATRPLAERITHYRLLSTGENIEIGDEHYDGRTSQWSPVAAGGMAWDEETFRPIRREIPRQLADERAELIASLKSLLFDSPNDGGMATSDNIADAHELLNRLNP